MSIIIVIRAWTIRKVVKILASVSSGILATQTVRDTMIGLWLKGVVASLSVSFHHSMH